MEPDPKFRRALLAIGTLAAGWAYVLFLSGGVLFHLGPLRLSSRATLNPLLIALVSVAAAWALSPPGRRWRTVAADALAVDSLVPAAVRTAWAATTRATHRLAVRLPAHPQPSTLVALLLAATIVGLGLGRGALVAGGSDAYGYVSQAQLWASGTLRLLPPPLKGELDGLIPPEAFVPLAYLPAADGSGVPIYSPGLPMLMGAVQRLGGSVFHVVPLLGGVAVFVTYLLGRRIDGTAAGLTAAALLAASPIFLFQLTSAPMSDIPAAACWTLTLLLVSYPSRRAAVAGGASAAVAILIRPNLAPLAVVPGIWLLWQTVRAAAGRGTAARLLLFAAGPCAAAGTLVVLNTYWYGSPLLSGYGPLSDYFSWSHAWPNLARYPRWLSETQTALIALAIVAPVLLSKWRRSAGNDTMWAVGLAHATWWLAAGVFLCYLFYAPFDAWWYLRFLLPALPALLVLTGAALWVGAARLPGDARVTVPVILTALVAAYGLTYAYRVAAFNPAGEWRYAIAGEHAARALPPRAVVLAMHHSGSARYYSGRPVLRYDLIPPGTLDDVLHELQQRGYHPYLLIDEWEQDVFREAHGASSRWGALSEPPVTVLQPGSVRIYDLSY